MRALIDLITFARHIGLLVSLVMWTGIALAADLPSVANPSPATERPGATGTTTTSTPPAQVNGLPTPDCRADIPQFPPPGDQVVRVSLSALPSPARGTIWQPRGDEVNFTLTSVKGGQLDPMNIAVCFRWRGSTNATDWRPSPVPLRTVQIDQTGTITYAARLPDLPSAGTNWFSRVFGQAAEDEYAGLWIVPLAEFRVVAASNADWKNLDVILPVGVTSISFSTIATILGILIAWAVLVRFSINRDVPGNDPIMKLISTRSGFASLSQLQIMIWTFVVGGSAIYVMALSGELIPISNGTLVLLGIAGVATVGAKLHSHVTDTGAAGTGTSTGTSTVALPTAPGVVTGLQMPPGFVPTDREVRLQWTAPHTGGDPDRYIVQYRTAAVAAAGAVAAVDAGLWITATATLTGTKFTVVGLTPATSYEFQVAASNTGDDGAFSTPALSGITTVADTTAGAPAPVTNVVLEAFNTDGTVLNVGWDAVAGANTFIVQYRPHDSDEMWRSTAPQKKNAATLPALAPNSLYDVRVAAILQPRQSQWSSIAQATTGPRRPLWSDLIVTPGIANSVDIARVQMLFFTVITALFVTMKVVTGNQIPEIPDGFLALMGISNGVYLTAKVIPG